MERRFFIKGLVGMFGVVVVGLPRLSKPKVAQRHAHNMAVLEAALETPEGRTKLTRAMTDVLRERLLLSRGRLFLPVRQIPGA
jgi:hypothetical protein